MQSTIRIQHISKRYDKREVLAGIDMTMTQGRIYGLIGPSGAGKTTLVKTIVGMTDVDEGSVEVLGRYVPHLSVLNNIGYMAQSDALYESLTGREHLAFFAQLYHMDSVTQKQRIRYVANLVDLSQALQQKVRTYSGGMKRRLSLAIALLHNPDVLILDEPTVGIDPALRASVWQELEALKPEKTIIVTTHVMSEAERCDDVAMIRDGRLLTEGSPHDLKKRYHAETFDDVFLQAGRSQ